MAFTQLGLLADRFGEKWRIFWLATALIGLCIFELWQYNIFAIQYNRFYELIPEVLLRALHILK